MQSRDFCYWLQGFFEVQSATFNENNKPEATGLTAPQVSMIRNHLNLVFAHEIDPAMGGQKHQDKLNSIHGPAAPGGVLVRC